MSQTETKGGSGELCVLLRCEPHLLALPVASVLRLVLASEAKEVSRGLVAVEGELFAQWDLAAMIGVAGEPRAYVLSHRLHRGSKVPLALRVGRCSVIEPVHGVIPMPQGLIAKRAAAFTGIFPVDARVADLAGDVFGVVLDPKALWTPQELDESLERVRKGPQLEGGWRNLQ